MTPPKSFLHLSLHPPQALAAEASGAWAAWGVFGLGLVAAFHVGKLPVALSLLQQEWGLSWVQAGWLLSLLQVAGVLTGLAVGGLADRWGPVRVMVWGLLTLGAGSALGAWSSSLSVLWLSRVLESAGFLWTVLPAPACIRAYVRDAPALQKGLGWWGAYMPTGTALALSVGGVFMPVWGWRPLWLAGAVAAWLAAAGLWWATRGAKGLERGVGCGPGVGRAEHGARPSWRATLLSSGPWALACGFFVYSGQWLAVVGFLPTLYAQSGWSVGASACLAAGVAGINALGNVGAGRCLARGWRREWVLATGYMCMALGAYWAFTPELPLWARMGGVLLFSALGGLVPGTLFASAPALTPNGGSVSLTVGWMQQLSAAGQLLGPPILAWWATQSGGWALSWVFTGLCSTAGLGVVWWLGSARPEAALQR